MCADLLQLKENIDVLIDAGVEMLHIDIMDGHYVPNFTVGPDFVQAVHKYTNLPIDIHLMIENVDEYIPRFALDDRCWISFHPETSYNPYRTIERIRQYGAHPGIAFEPAISAETYKGLVDEVDLVLVMTVSPGFAGQKLIPSMIEKIGTLSEYIGRGPLPIELEVDGNVSWKNIPQIVSAGATLLVAGTSSLFADPGDLRNAVARVRSTITNSAVLS
jgi:ribulose-phosphate 3-epimerase